MLWILHPRPRYNKSPLLLIVLARHQTAALVSEGGDGAVGAGVEVTLEELGDLVLGGNEAERDLVGALELHVESGDGEVLGERRWALGDGEWLGIDVDLDVVGGFVDGDVVWGLERGLGSNQSWDNAVEQVLCVDDGDGSEVAFGRGAPEVVAEDKELERVGGDGDFEQIACCELVGGVEVGVLGQRAQRDVDGVAAAPVQEPNESRLVGVVVVEKCLVVDVDVEGWVLRNEVPGDLGECLLCSDLLRAGVGEGRGEVVEVGDARVEAEVAWLDLHDLDAGSLGDGIGVAG